jgi:hypothetical protein
MKKIAIIFGLCAAISLSAMDYGIQIKTITNADFEANRKAKVAAIYQRPLFKKRPDAFEREQLLLSHERFTGVPFVRPCKKSERIWEDNQSDDEI